MLRFVRNTPCLIRFVKKSGKDCLPGAICGYGFEIDEGKTQSNWRERKTLHGAGVKGLSIREAAALGYALVIVSLLSLNQVYKIEQMFVK